MSDERLGVRGYLPEELERDPGPPIIYPPGRPQH